MGVEFLIRNVINSNKMKNNEISDLIDKYLDGQCSSDEIRLIEKWYDSLNETQREFYNGKLSDIDRSRERSLKNLQQKLGIVEPDMASPMPVRSINWMRWLVAASLLVFCSVGILIYSKTNKKESFITVSAGVGEVKQVILPDGTKVWLNAGSIIRYSSNYNLEVRDVTLTGEGYFDVKHDVKRPFNVYAGKLKTHVLGTAFTVSSYDGAFENGVTVTRGKVQVSDQMRVLGALLPDQKLAYEAVTGKAKIITVDAADIAAWRLGKLTFIEMQMQDIAIRLQQWYGIKIEFKDGVLPSRRFTASFNSHIKLEDLLKILSGVSHAKYKIDPLSKTVIYL